MSVSRRRGRFVLFRSDGGADGGGGMKTVRFMVRWRAKCACFVSDSVVVDLRGGGVVRVGIA